ncbi:MAG: alpha/beta hydrolase, partial [Acidimicrobiales bacterium]
MLNLVHSVLGHGPAFVWGHGLTSSRATEDRLPLLRWDTITGAGRQVVRYDAAGHGETGGPAEPRAYEWPQLAADLLALLDQLGLDRVDAGGASMGCASTLHAAVRAPDRFHRLVLVIPPTAWDTRAAQAEQYEASARYVERAGKAAWLEAAAEGPRPAIFADLPPAPMAADIPEASLPSVLRGAAARDLPA